MNEPQKHIALLCNPTPGQEKSIRLADEVAVQLKERHIRFSLFTTYWPRVWKEFTDAWIFGGDGTLHYFINLNPDFDLPLSVFPGGSGNDFHWMLYGQKGTAEQLEAVLQERAVGVDAGRCNGRLFLNGLGIGFDGAVVEDLLSRKKIAGKATYLLSIMKQLAGYRSKKCVITLGGERIEETCFMVSVANTRRYGGSFLVAPRAEYGDGLLDINIMGPIPPLQRMKYLPAMERGEHLHLPFNHYRQAPSVLIESASALPAHLDGEFFSADRFAVDCLPNKFRFSV